MLPKTPVQGTKVIVAYLDGRRLKGHVYNFSALKDFFDLIPLDQTREASGTRVRMNEPPLSAMIRTIRPAAGASISFIIFIASIMHSG